MMKSSPNIPVRSSEIKTEKNPLSKIKDVFQNNPFQNFSLDY